MSRDRRLRSSPAAALRCAACVGAVVAVASTAGLAQDSRSLADPLVAFINASSGVFGDEGPQLSAALDALDAEQGASDTAVSRAQRALAASVGRATPAEVARMHTVLGALYLRQGKPADAVLQLRAAATRVAPPDPNAPSSLALALDAAGDQSGARTAWRAAFQANTHDLIAAYWYARRLFDDAPAGASALARVPVDTLVAAALRSPSAASPLNFPIAGALNDQAVDAPVFAPARYAGPIQALLTGKGEAAIAALKRAAAQDPLIAEPAIGIPAAADGIRALRAGEIASAVQHLRDAVLAAPQSSEVHRALAMALWADQQVDAARAEFEAVIHLRPDDERAYLALADVASDADDKADATAVLERAVAAIPRSADAHWRLAKMAQAAYHDVDALDHYQACASGPPVLGAGRVWGAIGSLKRRGADFDAAARANARWVALQPNAAEAHRALGDAYTEMGRTMPALAERAAAALVSPRGAGVYADLAQTLAALGRYAEAGRAARRAVSMDPDDKEARYTLSIALEHQGRHAEGARELEVFTRLQQRWLAFERRTYAVLSLRLHAQVATDPRERVATWQRIIETETPTAENEQKLGSALAAAGRVDDAIAAYQLAVALGKSPTAFRALIDVYEKAGRDVEADIARRDFARAKRDRIRQLGTAP